MRSAPQADWLAAVAKAPAVSASTARREGRMSKSLIVIVAPKVLWIDLDGVRRAGGEDSR